MKVTRWPAILILALLISASLIIQPDNEVASSSVLQKNQPSLVGDIKNLSSTWYVAGSVQSAGLANHEVLMVILLMQNPLFLFQFLSLLKWQDLNGESEGSLLKCSNFLWCRRRSCSPKSCDFSQIVRNEGVSGEYARHDSVNLGT